MSVSGLSQRSLVAIGGVGALAAMAAFAAYRYYSKPALLLEDNFFPPLPEKPLPCQAPPVRIAEGHENSSVAKVVYTERLVAKIASFLPAKDIASLEKTCRHWRWLAEARLWKENCDQQGIPPIQRKGKNAATGEETIESFYKEAYLRLRPMIFGPEEYSAHLGVTPAGKIRPLKESIHVDLYRLDPSYMEPLPLQRNAQRAYRLFYLPEQIETRTGQGNLLKQPMTIHFLKKCGSQLLETKDHSLRMALLGSFQDCSTQIDHQPLDRSDWVLMEAGLTPGTPGASYANQVKTLSALGARPPKAIEVFALNYFNYFRFKTFVFSVNRSIFRIYQPSLLSSVYCVTQTTFRYGNHGEVPVSIGAFDLSRKAEKNLEAVVNPNMIGMAATYSCGT